MTIRQELINTGNSMVRVTPEYVNAVIDYNMDQGLTRTEAERLVGITANAYHKGEGIEQPPQRSLAFANPLAIESVAAVAHLRWFKELTSKFIFIFRCHLHQHPYDNQPLMQGVAYSLGTTTLDLLEKKKEGVVHYRTRFYRLHEVQGSPLFTEYARHVEIPHSELVEHSVVSFGRTNWPHPAMRIAQTSVGVHVQENTAPGEHLHTASFRFEWPDGINSAARIRYDSPNRFTDPYNSVFFNPNYTRLIEEAIDTLNKTKIGKSHVVNGKSYQQVTANFALLGPTNDERLPLVFNDTSLECRSHAIDVNFHVILESESQKQSISTWLTGDFERYLEKLYFKFMCGEDRN